MKYIKKFNKKNENNNSNENKSEQKERIIEYLFHDFDMKSDYLHNMRLKIKDIDFQLDNKNKLMILYHEFVDLLLESTRENFFEIIDDFKEKIDKLIDSDLLENIEKTFLN